MNRELPKVYEPQEVEGRIYKMWEEHGCFEGHSGRSLSSALPERSGRTLTLPP